jgi:hypothetical protein
MLERCVDKPGEAAKRARAWLEGRGLNENDKRRRFPSRDPAAFSVGRQLEKAMGDGVLLKGGPGLRLRE